MKQLLEFVVGNIVDNPKDLKVKEVAQDDLIVEKVSVDEAEMGKIIGKGGKVVKALRTLAKIYSLKQGEKYYLEISDPKLSNDSEPQI